MLPNASPLLVVSLTVSRRTTFTAPRLDRSSGLNNFRQSMRLGILQPQALPIPSTEPPMRKLKLESLNVESFDTTATAPRLRGTVAGHENSAECGDTGMSYCQLCHHSDDTVCETDTYDVVACGDTQYFDCSYGCTMDTGCCTAETQGADCVPA
jgi:hypothetical protein